MAKQGYDKETAHANLALEYPSCPEEQIPLLIQKLTDRECVNAPLPKPEGTVVTNHIRQNLTAYEAPIER